MSSDTAALHPPVKTPLHWPSLIQLILSLLAALILFGACVVIAISAAIPLMTGSTSAADPTGSFMSAASLAFAGILMLPSAWYSWKHLAFPELSPTPRREPRGFGVTLTILVLLVMAGTLITGNHFAQNPKISWLLLPFLNVIATGLPALWVIYIGSHGLIHGAPKRGWGVFASGLVLGPLVILVLELILLIFIGVLAILWVMVNPSLANQLNSLIIRIQNGGSNTEAIARALVPLIFNPGILFLGFAYMSVLVPLLEEALKPIGVWLLAGQKITPAQGFGYGVLSGAGFGLFENLGNTSSGVANWALLASTRVSTLLLHSFTAGLVGWALVSAWSERRYLRLAITYAIAVTLHGLWNGLALVSMATQLEDLTNISLPVNLQQAGTFSTYGIVALGVVVILLYFAANAYFRATIPTVTSAFPAGDHTSPDAYTSSQKVLPADQASQNDVHKTNLEASTPTLPPADLGDPPGRPDHDQNL